MLQIKLHEIKLYTFLSFPGCIL